MSRFLSLSLAKMPYLCSPLGKSSRFEVEEFESWRVGGWRIGGWRLEVGGWRVGGWRKKRNQSGFE